MLAKILFSAKGSKVFCVIMLMIFHGVFHEHGLAFMINGMMISWPFWMLDPLKGGANFECWGKGNAARICLLSAGTNPVLATLLIVLLCVLRVPMSWRKASLSATPVQTLRSQARRRWGPSPESLPGRLAASPFLTKVQMFGVFSSHSPM